MKKSFFTAIGALAIALAAPTVSAQQAAPAQAPAAQPAQADAETAIKRYVYTTSAKTLEAMADGLEKNPGSKDATAKMLVQSLSATLDMPIDAIPAEHQAFVRESHALSKETLACLEELISMKESGEMSEAELNQSLAKLLGLNQHKQMMLEAKYPESAKLLGQEAAQRLSAEMMPVLQPKAMPLIQDYVKEHPEVANDKDKITAVTFRILAKLLLEMAEAL